MRALNPIICLAVLAPFAAVADENRSDEHLLTQSELVSMETENAMWHAVRVEDDAEINLRTLRSKGFTEREVEMVQEHLKTMWSIDLQRNFGWLSDEAIERIETVDKAFIIKLRALRLFSEVGIQPDRHNFESLGALNRAWQRAIQRELNSGEISEFRLMNSNSAKMVTQLVAGLALNRDEFRTLCIWQRDYDGERGDESRFHNPVHRARQLEAKLDYWERVRGLLGDDRFAVYLGRADVEFDRMNLSISRLGQIDSHAVLDLWWIRKKHEATRVLTADKMRWEEERSETATHASSLLGPQRFASYVREDDAYWLKY